MRAEDLNNRLHDQPFRPFRVHLSDGSLLEIPHAGMVIVGRSTAVLPSRFGTDDEGRPLAERWRTVDLVHVVQFSDLDEPVNGKERKRRRRR
jgi:hypothetical protein